MSGNELDVEEGGVDLNGKCHFVHASGARLPERSMHITICCLDSSAEMLFSDRLMPVRNGIEFTAMIVLLFVILDIS